MKLPTKPVGRHAIEWFAEGWLVNMQPYRIASALHELSHDFTNLPVIAGVAKATER